MISIKIKIINFQCNFQYIPIEIGCNNEFLYIKFIIKYEIIKHIMIPGNINNGSHIYWNILHTVEVESHKLEMWRYVKFNEENDQINL